MRITRKVFSIYSEDKLINAIEEKAFCEGYIAAQKEFAEEDEARDRKRKIGVGLTGLGVVGGAVGAGKTLVDIDKNRIHFDKKIEELKDKSLNYYDKFIDAARDSAQDLRERAGKRLEENIKATGLNMFDEGYEARTKKFYERYEDAINKIDSDLKERVKSIEEKLGEKATNEGVEKLKGEAALNKGKIIKSGALKYGLPALAVTGIGAGMMYKNRKKKD